MANQTEIGVHLDLSSRHVSRLIKQGTLPAGKGHGGLDFDACRLAYIGYLRGISRGSVAVMPEGELDQHRERARLIHHQANIAALEERQTRGELLDCDDVATAWAGVLANFRAKILALPSKLAATLPGVDQVEVVEAAKKLTYEALEELSQYEIPEAEHSTPDSKAAA